MSLAHLEPNVAKEIKLKIKLTMSKFSGDFHESSENCSFYQIKIRKIKRNQKKCLKPGISFTMTASTNGLAAGLWAFEL